MTEHPEKTEQRNGTKPVLDAVFGNSEKEILKLDSDSVDIICIDPPYLYLKNQKLEKEFNEIKFFEQCKRVLTKDGFIIIFGRGVSFYRWNTILVNLGFTFKEEIIWDKKMVSSPMNSMSRVHETIAIHTIGEGKINKIKIPFIEANRFEPHKIKEAIYRLTTTFGNRKTFELVKNYFETGEYEFNEGKDRKFNATLQTDIKKTNRTLQFAITMEEGVKERTIISETRDHYTSIHPTQKPVRLLERLLMLCLPHKPKNEILVVDFFSGSFSCGEACYNLGINFKGFEIDEEYFNRGEKRLKDIQFKTTLF